MRHHFLPRFYLHGFTDRHVPPGQTPFVWLYYPQERRWARRAPHKAAAQAGYYSYTDAAGHQRRELEIALSRVESATASLIRGKIASQQLLDREERATLALFVALMLTRVPGQHEHVGSFASDVLQRVLDTQLQLFSDRPELLEKIKGDCKAKTGRSDLDELSLDDCVPGRYRVRTTREAAVAIAFSIAVPAATIIADMGWRFLVSKPPNWFITSDYPSAMLDPADMANIGRQGIALPNIEVTLPLTRTLAIMTDWQSKGETWYQVDSRVVTQVNVRSAIFTSRFIAAPKPDFPGHDHLVYGHRADREPPSHANT
jgi:hypothetical protein